MVDIAPILPFVIGLVRGKRDATDETKDTIRGRFSGIRCPACRWQPVKGDIWCCDPGCRHVWNTFETRGLCPSCGKQWHSTVCLKCARWSPHDEWYEESSEE